MGVIGDTCRRKTVHLDMEFILGRYWHNIDQKRQDKEICDVGDSAYKCPMLNERAVAATRYIIIQIVSANEIEIHPRKRKYYHLIHNLFELTRWTDRRPYPDPDTDFPQRYRWIHLLEYNVFSIPSFYVLQQVTISNPV